MSENAIKTQEAGQEQNVAIVKRNVSDPELLSNVKQNYQ
jgi:hypothetical protein